MPLVIRKVCGIVLIAAGILAIPVPIIPGIPLIVAGIAMYGNKWDSEECEHDYKYEDVIALVRSSMRWLRDRVGLAAMKEG